MLRCARVVRLLLVVVLVCVRVEGRLLMGQVVT